MLRHQERGTSKYGPSFLIKLSLCNGAPSIYRQNFPKTYNRINELDTQRKLKFSCPFTVVLGITILVPSYSITNGHNAARQAVFTLFCIVVYARFIIV